MTQANRADRDRRGLLLSVIAIVGSFLLDLMANVAANYVHLAHAWFQHDWLLVVSAVVSGLGGAGLAWFVYRWRTAERSRQEDGQEQEQLQGPDAAQDPVQAGRAFPPPAALAGRHNALRQTAAAQARRHGVVVIAGPAGSGASAVAIGAGWTLGLTPEKQRYVDLRGSQQGPENQRRAVIRVLRAIGIQPGTAQEPRQAMATMTETLRGTGTVLVLDNAERAEQISWIADGVPGASVIACGDVPARDLPDGIPYVRVGPLDPKAALELLARQGDRDGGATAPHSRLTGWPLHQGMGRQRLLAGGLAELLPGARAGRLRRRLTGMLAGHSGAAPNSIAERIDADPGAADELARSYLRLPRVAIDMGRWLAANPQVTLAALVRDLQGTEPNSELAFIVRRQLDGTSPGARRLLALLARAPAAELPQAAVAALADTGLDRTGDQLAELASRSLVEWRRPSRCRINPQARRLADSPGQKAVARSHARLVAYYARLAVARGEALEPGGLVQEAEEWLRTEDTALLQLLSATEPPTSVAAHLWQIAGVLDTWFAREHRPEDRRSAAKAMADASAALRDDTAGAVACLRLAALAREEGDFAATVTHLERAEGLLGHGGHLQSQLHAEWAVYLMTVGDLDAAWDHLLRCRDGRSRRDVRGRVADMINQAVVEIRLRRTEAARGTVFQAHALAEDAADHDGHAHAHELLGILAWRTGQPQRATREWTRALELYEQSANVTGQARCLQHQGAVLLSVPGGDVGEAAVLLARSLALRGGKQAGLGTALTHLYLAEVAAREPGSAGVLAHRQAGLAALRSWPHQGSEPPEVTSTRVGLTALGSNRPVDR
jgi:tetratricopeptide (TPR) repeat protein